MTAPGEKDHVLGDYAAFLKALLPQAQGFLCHDALGKLFWSDFPADGAPRLTEPYQAVLATVLRGVTPEADTARLALGGGTAFVLPLHGDAGRLLGALTVLTDRGAATMPFGFVRDLLAPALRILQRELSLRFRLVDGQRKLQVQAAEERLLHQVEGILDRRQPSDQALPLILQLCREHLGVDGVMLVIPDKHIRLLQGGTLSPGEAELISSGLIAQARDPGYSPDVVSESGELLWLPVHQRGRAAQGVFALQGCERSAFSRRRLARVARYVGSHIDSILDRDYDNLTGLAAFTAFERELDAASADAAGGAVYTVMCLDVDQLHVLNDNFGSEAGDEALVRLADLVRETLPGQRASRVTGDNFAVLLRDTPLARARTLGEEICARFRDNSFERGGQTCRPTVSIGVGPLAADGVDDANGALAAARVACKAAKERGGGRVEAYEPADQSIVRRVDDIHLVGYVRSAIENGRLALLGQRLMPLKNGRVPHYYEVLVRIVDEAGGHVPPAEFISAAERYNLMEDLDRWVVENTLRLLADAGTSLAPGAARFAINLSGQSLGSESFLPFVEAAIAGSGVAPQLITFEITESVAVARMRQAQDFMHALKRLGCRFSLDDFGTGLSSFAYLKLFPVDTLKIDGSFVRDLTGNVVSQSVVAAIAELARVMQLETVAEFAQDEATVDLLRSLNISYAQGHFVGVAEPLRPLVEAASARALTEPVARRS